MPAAVRDLIEHRFERLAPREQEVLEAAAVAGMAFASQSVAAALQMPIVEIEDLCMRLARAGQFIETARASVWPDGSNGAGFVFRHALYQQVLGERPAPALKFPVLF